MPRVHLNLRAVERAITFTWCGLCISLVADLYLLWKVDMFGNERISPCRGEDQEKKKVRTLPPFMCASQSMPYDLDLRALEKAITFTWCGLCISLVADLYSLNLGKVDMFGDERVVERV